MQICNSLCLCAGKPLTDERLLPEVSTLFMAGFESEYPAVPEHM